MQGYRATRSATATRTDTSIEEVPQSISVVPRQVIEDLGDSRIDRALDFAGGVGRQNDFGGMSNASFSVRGFTSGFSSGSLFRNGFSVNRGYYAADTATLERIEVLKGPTGGLFGRGDPGGVINMVSKRPQNETFNRLKFSAGRWDRYRVDWDSNAALTEDGQLLARVNLATETRKSFRDYVDMQRQMVAPAVTWHLTERTRLLLDSEFTRTDNVMDRGIPSVNGQLGGVKHSTFLGEPGDGKLRLTTSLLQLSLEHDFQPDWTARLAGQYLDSRIKGTVTDVLFSGPLFGTDTMSRRYNPNDMRHHSLIMHAEVFGKFHLAGMQHQLLAGIETENWRQDYYNHFSATNSDPSLPPSFPINIYNPIYGAARPATTPSYSKNQVKSYALNLQDQIDFNEHLSGLLGLRLENIKQQRSNPLNNDKAKQDKDVAVPRAGITYKLNHQVNLFAGIGTSFTPNNPNYNGQILKAEKGLGYEAGVKLDLLEGRLGATLATFHITKENVANPDPTNPGFSITVGEVRSQGIDAQVSGKIGDNFNLIAAYAFIDAKVTQDQRVGYKGSRLGGIPHHSGSVLGIWAFQEGLNVGASVNYVGQREFSTGIQAPYKGAGLPSYTTLDFLGSWEILPNVTAGIKLNNALNKKYYERSSSHNWITPGEPRNLNFNLLISF
ncbi:TonB-dependent siderophore receptor [Ventosimonas gracilis]|uniref:TonB-dependent siderophore receptor n=1 Tax=Ventosimonas gracilis TaxID=1680762 RepID=UPI000ABB86C3|nr:TonB-dependent siderophore receptor [Ventosimonas gracilis]